jgi:hypothetical protein
LRKRRRSERRSESGAENRARRPVIEKHVELPAMRETNAHA